MSDITFIDPKENQDVWDEEKVWEVIWTIFNNQYDFTSNNVCIIKYKSLVEGSDPFVLMMVPNETEIILKTIELLTTKCSYEKALIETSFYKKPLYDLWDFLKQQTDEDQNVEDVD